MARTRSPSYPAIPLDDAIDHAQRIFEGDHRHSIPRAVAARHLGYKSLHGGALTVLSALGKYGLLEMKAGNVRISDIAMELIAEPKGSKNWCAALRQAAVSPKLFSALQDEFGADHLPSDEALRAHLLKQGFTATAVGGAIRAYRETMALVSSVAVDNNSPSDDQASSDDDPEPGTFGEVRVGDYIHWESQGVLQFKEPKRVRAIDVHDGIEWIFVDGEKTGIPMDQAIVQERGAKVTPPTLPLDVGFQPHHANRQDGAGRKEDVFALAEGDVVLQWPERLSKESFEDLKAWAEIVFRKIEREITAHKLLHTPVHSAMATEYTDDEAGRIAQARVQELEERPRDEE